MSSAKAARWLDLMAFLMDRTEPVTRETIFERVEGYRKEWSPDDRTARETLRRKFERDKEELRQWGIEIETVPLGDAAHDEPQSGYRLAPRAAYLPYLQLADAATSRPERTYRKLRELSLSRDEVDLLDRVTRRVMQREESTLGRAAASLRRKLEFDLPLSVTAVERVLATPLAPETQQALAVLQDAVTDRYAVTCRYYTIGRDEERERTLEPYGLFFTWGRWYAVAQPRDRDDVRVFRADRMREVKRVAGPGARFMVPDGFSIRDYLDRAPWELSARHGDRVLVRFAFPESRRVLARAVGDPVETMTDDGGAVIAFNVADRGAFLRWLLTFRGAASVESPPDLRTELDALRARVAARYREDAS